RIHTAQDSFHRILRTRIRNQDALTEFSGQHSEQLMTTLFPVEQSSGAKRTLPGFPAEKPVFPRKTGDNSPFPNAAVRRGPSQGKPSPPPAGHRRPTGVARCAATRPRVLTVRSPGRRPQPARRPLPPSSQRIHPRRPEDRTRGGDARSPQAPAVPPPRVPEPPRPHPARHGAAPRSAGAPTAVGETRTVGERPRPAESGPLPAGGPRARGLHAPPESTRARSPPSRRPAGRRTLR